MFKVIWSVLFVLANTSTLMTLSDMCTRITKKMKKVLKTMPPEMSPCPKLTTFCQQGICQFLRIHSQIRHRSITTVYFWLLMWGIFRLIMQKTGSLLHNWWMDILCCLKIITANIIICSVPQGTSRDCWNYNLTNRSHNFNPFRRQTNEPSRKWLD